MKVEVAPTAAPRIRGRRDSRVLEWLRSPAAGIAAVALALSTAVANFSAYSLPGGDASIYFRFLRHLVGEHPIVPRGDHVYAYNFGLAYLNAPFYLLGKALRAAGLDEIAGNPTAPAMVALGAALYMLGAMLLAGWLLRRLQLPAVPFVLVAAVLGTPLFFYGVFSPGQTHTQDTFLFTAALVVLLSMFRASRRAVWLAAGFGALLGAAAAVRYFNLFALVGAFVALLALRRVREALASGAAGVATFLLLAIGPLAVGDSFVVKQPVGTEVALYPLSPVHMLFSDRRGLLLWSPVAILAIVGFVALVRRRLEERPFLVVAGATALGLILGYGFFKGWEGGWSFGQRYYTALFPFIAIGLGGMVAVRPRLSYVLAAVATAWTLFLMFNLQILGGSYSQGSALKEGAAELALVYRDKHATPGAYAWGVCRIGLFTRHLLGCR